MGVGAKENAGAVESRVSFRGRGKTTAGRVTSDTEGLD